MKIWSFIMAASAVGVVGSWSWADDDIKSGRMTAQQVANVFKNTNQGLSEGIAAAERHVGGKAVDAECFGATETAPPQATTNTVCMVTVLTKDNKLVQAKVAQNGQVLGQNNLEMAPGMTATQLEQFTKNDISVMDCIKAAERHVTGKAVQVEALKITTTDANTAACRVTVLTGDNKLVQANVSKNGQVLGQQNVESIVFGQGFAVAPGITSERTTLSPGTMERTGTATGTPRAGTITTSDRIAGTPAGDETASADDFAMPKRVQKASDLIGKNVTNAANENLGELKEIVIDAGSGRILYGVLSFGGFLGLGDKLFAIPWQSIRLAPDFKKFVLHVDKDRLKEAQGFDKEHWPNFADDRWATSTYKTFNQTPYWENQGRAPAMGSETSAPSNFRDQWYQKVTNWQKGSDLIGKDVHNHKNEDIGKISDLSIDPDSGRVLYGILSFRGKLFAVPFNAMSLTSDNKKVTINIEKDALKDNIAFTDRDWPTMTDPNWATRIHSVYNVQPYWLTGGPNRPNERP